MAERKVFVKNIPFEAEGSDVIKAFFAKGYKRISSCELKPHRRRADLNAGIGYVEFESKKYAKECLARAQFDQPICNKRPLFILSVKTKKIARDDDTIEIKNNFVLSSL